MLYVVCAIIVAFMVMHWDPSCILHLTESHHTDYSRNVWTLSIYSQETAYTPVETIDLSTIYF